MYSRRYAFYGFAIGLVLPLVATPIEALWNHGRLPFLRGVIRAQGSPLLWIIDTAPIVVGLFASLLGRRHDELAAAVSRRRDHYDRTARELFTSAQALLSTVSSFSSMTAETAASVRETTATMGQLGHTATQAAITAETVIGLAHSSRRASEEGLSAVEASTAEMTRLSGEVRGLSQKIDALNGRMRDIFGIASVVNYIAERSQRVADAAAEQVRQAGPAADGLGGVVGEMRHHADDAKGAAAQVKVILEEVHKAMVSAMTAAELGVRHAEQGAKVAAGTGETIRKLARALKESSEAAREIATVAQQQDHGIDQVLKAMNEIYLATQEAMASTQAVAAQARTLNDLASGLRSGPTG